MDSNSVRGDDGEMMNVTNGMSVVVALCAVGCASAGGKKQASKPEDVTTRPSFTRPFPPEADAMVAKLVPEWAAEEPDTGGAAAVAGVSRPEAAEPTREVLRFYTVFSDWTMERKATGVIFARSSDLIIFYKAKKDGTCWEQSCNLRQDEQGGSWGQPRLLCGRSPSAVTCSSVEALPPSPSVGETAAPTEEKADKASESSEEAKPDEDEEPVKKKSTTKVKTKKKTKSK